MVVRRIEPETIPALRRHSDADGGADLTEDLILSDDPDAPCLDLRAAAARIGVRPGTLQKWLSEGRGPPDYRLPGSTRLRFSRREIDEWVKSYKRTPSSIEMMRRAKLQSIAAAAARKRARRQTKNEEDATA
jgi:predicted DNA-binding transcriptional regulator AlpA